jgi:hypothetical protein
VLGGANPFSIVYYTRVRSIFDSALESGEFFGHKIAEHRWLDEPVGWESISRIGREMEAGYRSGKKGDPAR